MNVEPSKLPAPLTAASVVLPTYNEAANIVDLLRQILASEPECGLALQVVVVDDNSPDGTAGLVREKLGQDPRVKLVVRQNERGLATAIRRGVEEADNPVILFMDTDFNHHPRYLPALFHLLESCHISLGSRYVKGGGMNTSRARWFLSFLFNLLVRAVLGVKTRDNLSGFIAIRKHDLANFDFNLIFQGYGDYAIRLLFLASKMNLVIKELPVVYEDRQGGESKTAFVATFVKYLKATFAARRLG